MFKRNKSKDIDLLEQYYLATKKKNIFQEYLKYLILPLVLVFIIGGAFGYLKVKQGNYKNDIAEIKQKISDLEKSYKDSDYEEKYASLQEIQKTIDNLKKVNANIASYPNLSEDIYNACYKAALQGKITSSNYEQTTGELTLVIETSQVPYTKQIVKNLMDLNIFTKVRYSGYKEVEKEDESSNSGSIYMPSTTPEKLVVYQMTVICSLGGGINE